MNGLLFGLVNVVIVVIATGAPVANEENMVPAASHAENAEDMILVGKRAEEMVYYGNQQNEPRGLMKKSQPIVLGEMLKPPTAPGEVDQGAKMVVQDEIPVEEDLNDRAEAVKGESDIDRLAEGLKVAEETVEDAAEGASDVKDKKEDDEDVVPSDNAPAENNAEEDAMVVDLPESGEDSSEVFSDESNDVTDMKQNNNGENEEDDADEELASLSGEANSSEEEEGHDEAGEDDESSTDEDVEDFLDELRKESEDSDNDDVDDKVQSNSLKNYPEMHQKQSPVIDSSYYQTLYHILANTYNGSPPDDYYNYKTMYPTQMYGRRRRSPLHRREYAASIRSRRNGHVRRIKRDLPSDWLAAYRGLDIPYSEDIKDSLLSDPELQYVEDEPVSEELSRYIYANLLNKLYGGNLDADVEEEIPLDEILPYDLSPELQEPLLDEYEPEEILYEPENPYEEYIPSYEYRKRSGAGGYFPDSRRKRYFYPAFEEPETHWGAIVPEKRSSNDDADAIERLQRLAFALSENPRPYYESLLREYKKK